jgi:hypothetical protein
MAVQAEALMVEPPPPFDPRIHEAAITRDHGPPPISGGTLTTLPGGRLLVADPDTDRVLVVSSTDGPRVSLELAQPRRSEPGRSVIDTHGRAQVVLRGTGEVLSFDPSATTAEAARPERRAVCSMPRGLAFDEGSDRLVVVCRSGELVWLPAASGAASRTAMLEPDLRDVVLANGQLVVTRFRSAEALVVDRADGHLLARRNLAPISEGGITSSAAVAWRAIPLPTGEIAMPHQRERDDDVMPATGGYGGFGGCDGIVKSTISVLSGDRFAPGPVLAAATLPVDLAARNDGGRFATLAVVAAGNQNGQQSVFLVTEAEVRSGGCSGGGWISAQHSLANAIAVSFLGPRDLPREHGWARRVRVVSSRG